MDLNFEIFMIVLVVLGIVVVGNFLRDGESNWLEGALLVVGLRSLFFPSASSSIGNSSKVFCGSANGGISAKTDRLRHHRHRILVLHEPGRGDFEWHRGIGRLSEQYYHRQGLAKEPTNHGEPKSIMERPLHHIKTPLSECSKPFTSPTYKHKHDKLSIEMIVSPSTRALGIRSIPQFSAIWEISLVCCMGYVLFSGSCGFSVDDLFFVLVLFLCGKRI